MEDAGGCAQGCCVLPTICYKICAAQKGPVQPTHSLQSLAAIVPVFPSVRILHVLAAGGLVPSIYFHIYVLSLQLTATFPGRGRVCGRGQAPSLGGKWWEDCCCYSCSLHPAEGKNKQGVFVSETPHLGLPLSVTSCVTLTNYLTFLSLVCLIQLKRG